MSLSILLLLALAGEPRTINMGDGFISGENVTPYEYSWAQCSMVEGKWKNGSRLTERSAIIGSSLLRIDQTSSPQPGISSRVSHYMDLASLAPIRSEAHFTGQDGKPLGKRVWEFDADGYTAIISQGGKIVEKSGNLSNKMYNAIILGIPFAAIDDWDIPIRITGFMTQFDASYTITATQAGKGTVQVGKRDIDVRWIDVQWLHDEIGDVYPAGPDASGGRYWITEKEEQGLPRILRYKTDVYVIEHSPEFCLGNTQETESPH